ncbi:MAG TPA: hypothetical protein VII61_15205 [Ktedonobacteraceae bacterium]
MFTTITAAKGTAKRHRLFWLRGAFPFLILTLLASGFVGGGTGIAHASAELLPATVSSQQAASAPALNAFNATSYIGWTGTNMAHNLNLMAYNSTTKVFGPAQMLAETTLAGSGPSLTTWNSALYVAWRGTDNRLNVGQYNPANPSHLANKVTLNERSTNAPAIFGWPDHLYLSWRGTDGRLNIISSTNGSQFGSKVTYPFVIRTSPSLMGSDNSLFVAWEDMSVSSHIVIASSNDPSHPTNLTLVVTTTSTSLLPVGLASAGVPAPFVRVAWCTASDAHIHVGLFTDTTIIRSPVDTAQTTPYGPALYPNSLPLMSWTGTDTVHRINVISVPY